MARKKKMKIDEFEKGKCYSSKGWIFIFAGIKGRIDVRCHIGSLSTGPPSNYYHGPNWGSVDAFLGEGFQPATPEELHWLNVCISRGSTVSEEEAMTTFKKELPIFN